MKLPNKIFSGNWKEGHVQGIAVDTERGFVYGQRHNGEFLRQVKS